MFSTSIIENLSDAADMTLSPATIRFTYYLPYNERKEGEGISEIHI
jgi:hypothetical protein